jgi:hypothetical protein
MKQNQYVLGILIALFAFTGHGYVQAQTDVTDSYLQNAGFDASFDYGASATGQLSSGTIKDVPSWTHSTPANSLAATYEYGASATFNDNRFTIPANGYGNQGGGCLVLNAGWGGELIYTQAVTLPAGRYDVVYAVNNRNSYSIADSRFGFAPAGGTAVYSTTKIFAQDSWLTDTVTIDLAARTTGSISLGYVASSTYSYNNAGLCIDFVRLIYYDALAALKVDFGKEKALATANAARTDRPGFYNLAALNAALETANGVDPETVEQGALQAAYDALKTANEQVASLISAYAPLKRVIDQAQDYANNTDHPGRDAFLAAIAAAQAVYDDSADRRDAIAAAIAALNDATAAYRDTRPSAWTTIKNGALWRDNNGNAVQAHAPGFLQVGDKWYMCGEDRTSWNAGVNLYSSDDLKTWTFEKKIIPTTAYASNRFIERPKLMRCPSTGKFVVWCHYEGDNYAASEAASFVCDKVNGTYTLHFGGRPLGIKSRDCNVFVDNDGKGYFISTTDENQNLTLFALSDDYLDVVSAHRLSAFDGKQREAPAIVHIGNTYYLISSLCTGWDPNQATISYSSSLTSGWTAQANIGNSITFDTQAAAILTVQGTKGTTYLYVGDRWQDPALFESKTIIFPISFSGNSCTFSYRQQFDVNFATGETRETALDDRVPKTGWRVRACSSEETSSENGRAANAIDGNLNTKWHSKYSSPAAAAPHWIEIDMNALYEISGFLAAPRSDGTSGLIREFLCYVSVDGETWTAVAGGAWLPYFTEVYFPQVQARYFRLVSLSGSYASLAELDILQNTSASYVQSNVRPYYQINSEGWATSEQITVNQASNLTLGPNASEAGSWAWILPDGTSYSGREYALSIVAPFNSGAYTVFFLDQHMSVAKRDYQVTVAPTVASSASQLSYAIQRAQAVCSRGLVGAVRLQRQIDGAVERQGPSYSAAQKDSMAAALSSVTADYIAKNVAVGSDQTSRIITAKNFTSTAPAGWEGTMPTGKGSGCAEFVDTVFAFSQTLSGLQNGYYLVGVQAFYRCGSNDKGAGYLNGSEAQNVRLHAGSKSIFVESLYAHPYPNGLNGYANLLSHAGELFGADERSFSSWLQVEVRDSSLTVSLRKDVAVEADWCAFNNFRLYYLGDSLEADARQHEVVLTPIGVDIVEPAGANPHLVDHGDSLIVKVRPAEGYFAPVVLVLPDGSAISASLSEGEYVAVIPSITANDSIRITATADDGTRRITIRKDDRVTLADGADTVREAKIGERFTVTFTAPTGYTPTVTLQDGRTIEVEVISSGEGANTYKAEIVEISGNDVMTIALVAATGVANVDPSDPVVSVKYYNLQGQEVKRPALTGIYILRKLHLSGRTTVEKRLVREGILAE